MKKISPWLIILLLFTACGKEANRKSDIADVGITAAEEYKFKTEEAEQITADSTAGGV